MKKPFHPFFEIVQILVNCLTGALYFIKIDHDVAVLPDSEGGTARFEHWYSIYDKLLRENLQVLIYLALATAVVSVALSVLTATVKGGRKLKTASRVLFAVSVLFFLGLFFFAAQIQYYY